MAALVGRAHHHQPHRRTICRFADGEGSGEGQHAPHAVAEEDELLDRDRPGGDEPLEERRQLAPVRRDVPAAVVMQVEGGEAEVAGEGRAVIVPVALT